MGRFSFLSGLAQCNLPYKSETRGVKVREGDEMIEAEVGVMLPISQKAWAAEKGKEKIL